MTENSGKDSNEISEAHALSEAIRAITGFDPADRWVEILAALVLALATIASAWSAYQATRWSGVQATAFAEASATRAESVRASDLADADLVIDMEYFAIWLDGASRGDDQFTAFLQERMRAEFEVVFQAWLDTDPLNNPGAPDSPFEMDEYQPQAAQEAEEWRLKAEAAAQEAITANQTADNYVLTTVLFASVLFFAGISTKFRGRWLKAGLLGLGFLAFAAGMSILITFPIY